MVTDLENGTEYTFVVRAENADGSRRPGDQERDAAGRQTECPRLKPVALAVQNLGWTSDAKSEGRGPKAITKAQEKLQNHTYY